MTALDPYAPVVCWSSTGCDCEEEHAYFCVGCGTVEHSADGKVYFYTDPDGSTHHVCWDCVRGPNPHYIWWREVWSPDDKGTVSPEEYAARALVVSKLGGTLVRETP